jgi:hypothetical protein
MRYNNLFGFASIGAQINKDIPYIGDQTYILNGKLTHRYY